MRTEIAGFRGLMITPELAGYDDARAVWNGRVDRSPQLIARCTGAADVAAAVRFARERDLEIAVRGGGHNVAGTAVCDDGIVIDLSAMRAVSVDAVNRTADVQGGALWGDVDHETQAHGLATTGGIIGHTGVGGLSLGGGLGWLMRKHGLTVDNLIEAEVVTAAGDIVRASTRDHPDLFWALRGGGGNFGVVTSFRFALHPVGPAVVAGPVFWAAEDTTDVMRFYREFVADAPDELGTVIRLGTIPPFSVIDSDVALPTGDRGRVLLRRTAGGRGASGSLAAPVRDPARRPRRTHALRRSPERPRRHRPSRMALLLEGHRPRGPVRRRHRRHRGPRRSRQVAEVLRGDLHLGGAIARVPRDATAYPGRDIAHHMTIDAVWLPAEDESVGPSETEWAREFFDALQPHRAGVYVNFLDADDDSGRVGRPTATPPTYGSTEIKSKYDPENVFHHNKNIEPWSSSAQPSGTGSRIDASGGAARIGWSFQTSRCRKLRNSFASAVVSKSRSISSRLSSPTGWRTTASRTPRRRRLSACSAKPAFQAARSLT